MTHAADLFERAFEVELERINASWLVNRWATQTEQVGSLADLGITSFIDDGELPGIAWSSNEADDFSFLGNEFLMWLWWFVETQGDTIELSDETEVTLMFVKTLQLECPWGDWGREVLSSDSPIKMPEAVQAIRAGKLPRKAGFIFVRNGQQFEFVLQAETFAISSAKIVIDEPEDNPQDRVDARIDSVRCLSETVDLLFESFLDLRVSDEWAAEQKKIRRWLRPAKQSQKKPAA